MRPRMASINMMLNLANGAATGGRPVPEFDDLVPAPRCGSRLQVRQGQVVAQLGWKGDIIAKLHYAWESNSVANWQNDPLAPYNVPALASGTSAIFMAYDNPNYNVQMLMASLGL